MNDRPITYKELYDLVDKKTGDLQTQLTAIQKQQNEQGTQLATMQGQSKIVPFLISTSLSVFAIVVSMVGIFFRK